MTAWSWDSPWHTHTDPDTPTLPHRPSHTDPHRQARPHTVLVMPSLPFRVDMFVTSIRTRRVFIGICIFIFLVIYFRSLAFKSEPVMVVMCFLIMMLSCWSFLQFVDYQSICKLLKWYLAYVMSDGIQSVWFLMSSVFVFVICLIDIFKNEYSL